MIIIVEYGCFSYKLKKLSFVRLFFSKKYSVSNLCILFNYIVNISIIRYAPQGGCCSDFANHPRRSQMTSFKCIRILMQALIRAWGISQHIQSNATSSCCRFVGSFSNLRSLVSIVHIQWDSNPRSLMNVVASQCYFLWES